MEDSAHGLEGKVDMILKLFQPDNHDSAVLRDGQPPSWGFSTHNLCSWAKFPSHWNGGIFIGLSSLDGRFTHSTSLGLSQGLHAVVHWEGAMEWHPLCSSPRHLSCGGGDKGWYVLARVRRLCTSEACGRIAWWGFQCGNDEGNLCHGIGKVREGPQGDLGTGAHRPVGVFRFAWTDLASKSRMVDRVDNPAQAVEEFNEFCRLVAQRVLLRRNYSNGH